ncbi:tubulin-tyrosine ligase family protein, putative [Ichthyophthirius multifiliis]|uniref:Tubulin-tyrosine ligase family protein, putative n=1 Tax=Ichthyophthirius multifiliis TaxID=5932 RepID=G0R2D2_ICHMU|nr:tubulin-tyrosine ligase family protein, putative [Ichthyophthirius multifiliis]EGR28368.1 tubulin-tyrosine ligase family protein, putative [Ichthyophthirius multifiliis]|eukprot:XP_004027713.1 tubulin-tyrosine ligase family protein, putative [Ichthyophthirius multifiliis]
MLLGQKYKIIKKYFDSRQDFEIIHNFLPQQTDFYFKFTDFNYQQNYKLHKNGEQLINHIQNIKNLLSNKDSFIKTLKEYDNNPNNHFNKLINSTHFLFESYIFDLKATNQNEQEKYFFEKVNSNFWIAKNPKGTQGKDIKLFKNVNELKDQIKQLKQNQQQSTNKTTSMYSFVQKYLEKPLLIYNHKNDLRSYILIASIKPFVVLYQDGHFRKCIEEYNLESFVQFDIKQSQMHLTNRQNQSSHKDFNKIKESLTLSIEEYKNYLKKEKNLKENDIQQIFISCRKAALYSILAAKDRIGKKKGQFQLLGLDLIIDENLKCYILEFNTNPAFFMEQQIDFKITPQLVQSHLDIIIESHETNSQYYWKNANKRQLGQWEVLYNEATNYNLLINK